MPRNSEVSNEMDSIIGCFKDLIKDSKNPDANVHQAARTLRKSLRVAYREGRLTLEFSDDQIREFSKSYILKLENMNRLFPGSVILDLSTCEKLVRFACQSLKEAGFFVFAPKKRIAQKTYKKAAEFKRKGRGLDR